MKLLLKKIHWDRICLGKKNVWAISTIDFKTTKWWHFFRILILWPAYYMTCLQGLLNLIYTYNIILIFGDITGIWELGMINCLYEIIMWIVLLAELYKEMIILYHSLYNLNSVVFQFSNSILSDVVETQGRIY